MKLRIIARVLIYSFFVFMLVGCFGISPEQYNVVVQVEPNLSGVFVLESQFSSYDIDSYANSNNLSNPQTVLDRMADDIANNFGWTFPYEKGVRQDGDYIWLQMAVNFTDEDRFCSILPAVSADEEAQAAGVIGEDSIYYCALQKTYTPYTDVFLFSNTIYPSNNPGKLTVTLPGSVAETNGSPLGESGVTWSWNNDVVAVPVYAITAGLVDFKVDINVDIKSSRGGNLQIITTAPQEVVPYAKSIYPSADDPITALADRIAQGLNLSEYKINIREVGSKVEITIEISDLSSEEIKNNLLDSGLMNEVTIVSDSSLFKSRHEFIGSLSAWENAIGSPDSITLTINLPGQSTPQTFTAAENLQPVSASSETTNWLGITGIGLACLFIIIGGFALVGSSIFMLRRKKA